MLNYANKLDNDMNVFDLLPLDILKYILLMLPRQSIKYMFQISTVRRKLNLQEVLNSRKLLAYPRESSYCEMHHIPASIIDIQNFVPSLDELHRALKYLDHINRDLVRGDIIIFDSENDIKGKISTILNSVEDECSREAFTIILNNFNENNREFLRNYNNRGRAIFDGYEIINLCHGIDDYDALPSEFCVLEYDISIDYWRDYRHWIGGILSNIIWFNHVPVKDECLDNINCCQYDIFTKFHYNGKKYKLMTNSLDIGYNSEILNVIYKESVIGAFRSLLLGTHKLMCYYKEVNDVLYINVYANLRYQEDKATYQLDKLYS